MTTKVRHVIFLQQTELTIGSFLYIKVHYWQNNILSNSY